MDSFYDELKGAPDSVSSQYMRTPTENWNAKSGAADMAIWHILGKLTVGLMCANGDRLVDFISTNRLVVSSTDFLHPRRHFEA